MEPRLNQSLTPRFWELDPIKGFQPLCRDILEQEPGIDSAEEYGTSGQSQSGIDILGKDSTGQTIVVGQCKCCKDYKVANVTQAGDAFYKHHQFWKDRGVREFILIVACDLADRKVQDEIHKQYTRFESLGIIFKPWSGSTLRNKLMPYPDIAQRYLPPEIVRNICGTTSQEFVFNPDAPIEDVLKQLRTMIRKPDHYDTDIEDLMVKEAQNMLFVARNSPLPISGLSAPIPNIFREYLQPMIDASEKLVKITTELIKSDRKGRFNDSIIRVFEILAQDTIQYQGGYTSYTPGVPEIRLYPLALMIYNLYIIGVKYKSTNLLRRVTQIRFRSKHSKLKDQKLPGILWQMYYESFTNEFFKIIEPNGRYHIPESIKNILLPWLQEYVDFPGDAYYCGEFVLSLTMLDSNDPYDGKYGFPSIYIYMIEAKDILKHFIMTKKDWLKELFPDIENRLQVFDQYSSERAKEIIYQRAYGFYGNALNLYRES